MLRSMKKISASIICIALAISISFAITGCSKGKSDAKNALADGKYVAKFKSDSKMFHVNEAYSDKGILTVKDGKMTMHISLASKNIVNLYKGKAEDAKKDGAKLIKPSTDTIHFEDGINEEVYGFDVSVSKLNKEFDLALIGTRGKWYDHKVKVVKLRKLKKGEDVEKALLAKEK